jgi:hypothetical protein
VTGANFMKPMTCISMANLALMLSLQTYSLPLLLSSPHPITPSSTHHLAHKTVLDTEF